MSILYLLVALCAFQDPATAVIELDGETTQISPYIYGTNSPYFDPVAEQLDLDVFTALRAGGNRWTAYNWETNASNAGHDWHHQNDSYLGGGEVPGGALADEIEMSRQIAAPLLATVQMAGHVSADKNGDGDVNQTPNYLNVRFHPIAVRNPGGPKFPPNLTDKKVFMEDFAAWLQGQSRSSSPIWFCLDNEPDLWSATHPRVHPNKVRYDELMQKTVATAAMIKDHSPGLVFGPISYGWNGYRSLQDAPDAAGRDFVEFYLKALKTDHDARGKRIVDVLSLNYYSEARGDDTRVVGQETSPGVVRARIQAPRSLWDREYRETSWITEAFGENLYMIPRMREKIDRFYPGTKLAITEYTFGGGMHISGALAQADALGIFGREGLFLATLWPLTDQLQYVYAGFRAYRDYDRAGSRFGELALPVSWVDPEEFSVYASRRQADGAIVIVAVHKSERDQSLRIRLEGAPGSYGLRAFLVDDGQPIPAAHPGIKRRGDVLNVDMPATSIVTIELKPTG